MGIDSTGAAPAALGVRTVRPAGQAARATSDRLSSVQVLRGLAAMLVLATHACVLVIASESAIGPAFVKDLGQLHLIGNSGVDLFFVISGFVMALSARRFRGMRGAVEFLVMRFMRIAPLFYVICVPLALNLALRFGGAAEGQLGNTLLFVPWLDFDAYRGSVHPYGWTLAFEFVFYLVVAVPIMLGASRRPAVLMAIMLALPLLGFALNPSWIPARMLVNEILLEFALGVAAFTLWERGWLARLGGWAWLLLAAAFTGYAVSALGGNIDAMEPAHTWDRTIGFQRVLAWGIPSFLLFCFAVSPASAHLGGRSRLPRLLGDASYSIYLSQVMLLFPLQRLVRSGYALPADLMIPATIAGGAALGVLVYWLVERPLTRVAQSAARRWLGREV